MTTPESNDVLEDKVEALVLPVVEALGLELVDVEYVTEDGRKILRVTIEKAEGISLDDCTDVSRELSTVFDVDDVVPERYALEVSSPGLDRRLKKRKHFLTVVGKKIKIKTKLPVDEERRNFQVILKAVGESTIDVEDSDERLWTIELDNIDKARLEIVL